MVAVISEHFQVVREVIHLIAIFMMHHVFGLKIKQFRDNSSCYPLSLAVRIGKSFSNPQKGGITALAAKMIALCSDSFPSPFNGLTTGCTRYFNFVFRCVNAVFGKILMHSGPAYMQNVRDLLKRPKVNGVCLDYVFVRRYGDLHGVLLMVFDIKGNTINARCQQ